MPELLPISEAAQRLGISVDAVRKKIRRGTITAVKRDNRWYVEVPDIDTAQDEGYAASSPAQDDAITHELVELLRAELDAKNRQIERLTLLLGNSQQTVMLLTEGRSEGPPPAPDTVNEESPHRIETDAQRGKQGQSRGILEAMRRWLRNE